MEKGAVIFESVGKSIRDFGGTWLFQAPSSGARFMFEGGLSGNDFFMSKNNFLDVRN